MIFDDILLIMRRCLGHNTKWTHGYGLVVVFVHVTVCFPLFVASFSHCLLRYDGRMKWMVDLMHCAGTIDCGLMALVETCVLVGDLVDVLWWSMWCHTMVDCFRMYVLSFVLMSVRWCPMCVWPCGVKERNDRSLTVAFVCLFSAPSTRLMRCLCVTVACDLNDVW